MLGTSGRYGTDRGTRREVRDKSGVSRLGSERVEGPSGKFGTGQFFFDVVRDGSGNTRGDQG